MRTAIYGLSSKTSEGEESLKAQIRGCRSFCKKKPDLTVVESLVIAETVEGDLSFAGRHVLRLYFERHKEWDCIVCEDFKLLASNEDDLAWLRVLLEIHGKTAFEAGVESRQREISQVDSPEDRSQKAPLSKDRAEKGLQDASYWSSETETTSERLYHPISPRKLAGKLYAHHAWLEKGKKFVGERCPEKPSPERQAWEDDDSRLRLDGAQLTGVPLPGIDLRHAILASSSLKGATLQGANLDRADLAGAQLDGADLVGASMLGANLREASLSKANLRGADLAASELMNAKLKDVVGLMSRNLSGSNVSGAELPDEIKKFEALSGISAAADNSRILFNVMLLGSAYAVLAIATTPDTQIVAQEGETTLPIIRVSVSIRDFYYMCPVLLVSLYIYLNLGLQNIWKRLASLPAYLTDGRRLDLAVHPWLVLGMVGAHFQLLRIRQGTMKAYQLAFLRALVWGLVPFTLLGVWLRYLAAHEPYGTALQIVVIGVGWAFAVHFDGSAKHILRDPNQQAAAVKPLANLTFPVLLMLACTLLSVAVYQGKIPYLNPDFSGRDLTTESPDVVIKLKKHLSGVLFRTVDLSYRDLSWAELSRAVLQEADLVGANLMWANLSESKLPRADLSFARLGYAKLIRAELFDAELVEADLRQADLDLASLNRANLRGAKLDNATAEGAVFEDAHLEGTTLTKAKLNSAIFLRAKMFETNLGEARLRGATLDEADLRQAQLPKADLSHATLIGTDLRGANLNGAILKDVDLELAQLQGVDLSKVLNLDPEALAQACLDDLTVLPDGWEKKAQPKGCQDMAEKLRRLHEIEDDPVEELLRLLTSSQTTQ